MEIKISINGIYKRIPNNLKSSVQLNDLLAKRLAHDENIFAVFSSARRYYVWTLPGDGWQQLSGADDGTASVVRNILEEKKNTAKRKLSADPSLSGEQVDQILSVPSDDFVYYKKDATGNISVLLVAWDYQLPTRQISSGGRFQINPNAKKNDVTLRFIEAGKPASGYPILIKGQGGKFIEKTADTDGCYPMPGLSIGMEMEIYSADKSRDFSFTVTADKSEYVHDVTGPLTFDVQVTKDAEPLASENVTLRYSGHVFSLKTDAGGSAQCTAEYREGSEVIAGIDGNEQTVAVEYPVTGIIFRLKSPIAEVLVKSLKNGKASEGDKVEITIRDYETKVRYTGTDGTVKEAMKFRDGAVISVSVGGETKSSAMTLHNEFLFERVESIYFSPVLIIKDTDGNAVPAYPVTVSIAGKSDNYVTDDDGTVHLPEVADKQTMEVCDGRNPSNCRTYELDAENAYYEFFVTLPPVEYYNIFLKCNRKALPANISASLLQNGKNLRLDCDSSGCCKIRKDEMESGKDVLTLFKLGDEELGRMNIQFLPDEDDYELNINLKKRIYIWDIIKQILAALLVALIYWFALFVLLILM